MSYKSSNGDLLVIKMKINKKEQNFKAKQNKQKTSSKKNNPWIITSVCVWRGEGYLHMDSVALEGQKIELYPLDLE